MKAIFGLLVFTALVTFVHGQAMFPRSSGVVKLNKDNFEKKVISRQNQIYLVNFYSPKSKASKELQEEWVKTAGSLQALAKVGAVDCLENRELCKKNGVKKMPHIVVFKSGKPQNYTKARTAKYFSQTAKDLFPRKLPSYSMKKNAHKKFNKKNKKLPKVLFFKSKKETSLLARAMAFQFKGRMAFAAVEKFERKINKACGVKKWPAVGVVKAGDDDKNIALYTGKMTPLNVAMFLESFALESKDEEDPSDYPEQLTDDSCMNFLCKAGGLCAVLVQSINPDKSAINQIKNELTILNQVERNRQDNFYTFAWMDAISQMEFLDKAFGVTPQEYPQLVLFTGTKKRMAVFVGAYREDTIGEFLNEVQKQTIKSVPMGIKELPNLKGDTERCKGMKREFKPAKKETLKLSPRGHRKDTVADLTATNFDDLVLKSKAIFMVAFVAGKKDCPTCEAFIEEFTKAQKEIKQIVKFGIIDLTEEENEDLAKKYHVEKFPDVRVFAAGKKSDDSDAAEDYTKEKTAEALVKFARNQVDDLKGLQVKVMDETLFPGWVRENFYHPRFILFTAKNTVPPMWKALTNDYVDDDIKFAVSFDRNLKFGSQFNVTQFPMLIFCQGMPPTTEQEKKTGQVGFNVRGMPKQSLKYEVLSQWFDEISYVWPHQKKELIKTNPEGFPKEADVDDEGAELPDANAKGKGKGKGKGRKSKREL